MKEEKNLIVESNDEAPSEDRFAKFGKRTPLHKQQASGIKPKPGFVRYGVVELPGRVERFLHAGWRPVTGDDLDLRDGRVQQDTQLGSVVRSVVNRKPGAQANTRLYMEIPEEIWRQDQAEKEAIKNEKLARWNPVNQQKGDSTLYGGHLEIK